MIRLCCIFVPFSPQSSKSLGIIQAQTGPSLLIPHNPVHKKPFYFD